MSKFIETDGQYGQAAPDEVALDTLGPQLSISRALPNPILRFFTNPNTIQFSTFLYSCGDADCARLFWIIYA